MNKLLASLALGTLLLSSCFSKKADLLVYNALVYTVNDQFDTAEAFAISDGKILAVGSNEEIKKAYSAAEMLDAQGKAVYPGFIDAHAHFYGYGESLQTANLRETGSWAEVCQRLTEFAKTHPEGWLIGEGWDQNDWQDKRFPTRTELDRLFPGRPVLLRRIDGHAAMVNGEALKLAGITKSYALTGGEIVHEQGQPTGLLIDNAIELVAGKIPPPSAAQAERILLEAQEKCFAAGLTTIDDCGVDVPLVNLIEQLQADKKLKMRLYLMLSDKKQNYDYLFKRGAIKTDLLNVRSFKVYADGALGSRGACLLHPYSDMPNKSGFLLSEEKHFEEVARQIAKHDFQMCTHAIGDSANRTILKIYNKVLGGKNDKRWRIEHAQVVNPEDFHLFGKASVVPSVQPTHATSDMYWAGDRLGKERVKGAYAYRQLMEENGWIPLGTDFPVEDINPMFTFYAASVRKDAKNYPAEGFQMENALSKEETLRGMTIWAAKANFEEKEKGSLETGKFADFVILDQDIMTSPASTILNTKVLKTYVNGEKVYEKNNRYRTLTLSLLALISFSACAQEHRKNEQQLKVTNAVINNTVLLNNEQNLIPLKGLDMQQIASVNLGFSFQKEADSLLNKYAKITSFQSDSYAAEPSLNSLEDDLKYFTTVIVALTDQGAANPRYQTFISNLAKHKQVIVSLYGQGKALSSFDQLQMPLVWSSANSKEAAMVVPQLIFGGIAATKKLQTPFSARYPAGAGFLTAATRLKYTVPEDAGVNSDRLKEIDQIVAEGINAKAAPGMVVLVAKDGKVIFNKAYGRHTYDSTGIPEQITDIFDLASVTKTTATTPTVMRLVEEGKLNLDTNIGAYIPRAKASPMNNISVREVMLHQAGFIPFIPFHNFVKPEDHQPDSSAAFPTKVADGYFVKKDFFKDFMWPKMLNSPIKTRGKYVYSDISMYVMKDIVERLSMKPLDTYVQDNFYASLGMKTAGFVPRRRFAKEQIVPTENDMTFRKTLLEGYVHDQGAALVGGVSGHAGLFGSANDVAIMYQMLLNKGSYGGQQYFKPETVAQFTSKQSDVSRRGLGFDRWDPDTTNKYPSELASPQTFGHTGYTGTCVWVDPARGLVYVFLSNRVHPGVSEMLGKLKIRGRIQDVVNKAIDAKN